MDKQKMAFLVQYKGRDLDQAFCDQYLSKLHIDKVEGRKDPDTGITLAYAHHSKRLRSDQWRSTVQKHNAIFPEQQLTWIGITAPDPYDLRLSQAYQAIKVSKEYFQWRKEECKERPLGIGHKRKAAPAGEKKAKRQHTQDLEEQRKRALLRAFIEASVAYLQSHSQSLQAKAEARAHAEASAKAKQAQAEANAKAKQAQAEAKAKQAQAEASAKAKQEEEAKAKAKQAEEEKAKQRAREERLREQQAQRVRELQAQQAEEERERMEDQKHLKALEPDIKFLASLAGSRAVILCPTLFLKQVYHLHPPPRPLPPIQSGADRKDLLNAIRAYHADKNTKCTNRHRIMCSEITKILNGLLEAYS